MLICLSELQAISKFESLVNQVQKNAKDINSRLSTMEKTVLFKRPPKKNGMMYLDAKVSHHGSNLRLRTVSIHGNSTF